MLVKTKMSAPLPCNSPLLASALSSNNDRPDPKNPGEKIYGYNFIIEEIDFGAPGPEKRAMLAKRQAGQAPQGSGDDYDDEPGRFPPI